MSNQLEKIKELIERRAVARIGGGEKAIAKQHEKGKYTARERLAMLLDSDPAETVKSCANTYTRRPSIVPQPVTTPSPG